MSILVVMFLLAAPAWAEDLGELSANPVGLSGSFGLSRLSGFLVCLVSLVGVPIRPTSQTRQTR